MNLKARIIDKVGTSTEMIRLLRERGVYCTKPQFSNAINYRVDRPKEREIREMVREVLEELERK